MQIVVEHSQWLGYEDALPNGETYYVNEGQSIYRLLLCQACNKPILDEAWQYDDEGNGRQAFKTLYPPIPKNPKSIPSEVESALAEAEKVRTVSPNAYGVMCARALERICHDKKCGHGTLQSQIEKLLKANEIPERLARMAQNLRMIRNHGAHGGGTDLTLSEVPVVQSVLRALVEYIYSGPELLAEAESCAKRLDGMKSPSAKKT